MKIFGRRDRGGAEVEWTSGHERELEEGEADMAGLLQGLRKPAANDVGRRLGAGLQRRATERFLQVLDKVLQRCEIGREQLPGEAAVGDWARLSFVRQEDTLGIRLALEPGKLVDRQAILAHDQNLWSSGGVGSLAILLHSAGGGPPVVAVGPGVAGTGLEWTLAAAELGPAGYRGRLECFAAPDQRRYAYGLAAGAELAGGEPGPLSQQEDEEEDGPCVVFSRQEGGPKGLVVGVEGKFGEGQGGEFAAFERRLLELLASHAACELISRFPTSGRLYLALEPALLGQVEEAIGKINKELADRG
ncbi:MAG: hypothetical protein GKR89_15875 [Candidatus Latescibacteria bacterium]|nr:hypothetical protein [Candidatus Latescibacterota bacterium]